MIQHLSHFLYFVANIRHIGHLAMTTPVWCWTHRLQKDLLIGFQYCSHLGEEPAMLAEIGQRIRIIQWIDLRSQKKSIFFYFGRSWLFYLFRGLQEGEHLQESISETTIFTCRCSCWPILGNHIGELAELSFSSIQLKLVLLNPILDWQDQDG